jgi:hypothetical protein
LAQGKLNIIFQGEEGLDYGGVARYAVVYNAILYHLVVIYVHIYQ